MTGAAATELEASVAVYRLEPDAPSTETQAVALGHDHEWMAPLLRQNAVWFCRLRWLVVAVLCTAAIASFFPDWLAGVGLAASLWWPLGCAAFLTISNLVFISLIGRAPEEDHRSVKLLLWAQIVSDLLVLTAVIHWLGHELPAAPFMYLFHVILACIVFTPGESLAVAGLAAAFYLGLLSLESAGWLGRSTVIAVLATGGGRQATAPAQLSVASMLAIWSGIWYLVSRLASAFRSRDHELFITNRRLRASIEERSKHMLQTTHQLKAPFAAIHAQSQLLLGEYCGVLPPLARATVERIGVRCRLLATQIQEMLQLANLRSQSQTTPPSRRIDLAALIEEVIARVEPSARQRGIRFEKDVQVVTVNAVEDHLTMLIDNLLVNAVNYSHENGRVTVACRAEAPEGAKIIVRDHGIGIAREKLPRIFDDYFRTEEAVRHNSGSTGLGLAIVRQVARKGRLPITVESASGWGTRFTVGLPQALIATPASLNSNH
ncbi:MAG: sensor histidine kinase [Verrucomicrobiia bacterium]